MTATISELWFYPIKSCRGISVATVSLDRRGIANDRRYMLIDEQGRFVTQRETHALARVMLTLHGSGYRVSADGFGQIDVPAALTSGERVSTVVWRSSVAAEVHPEASRWFSDVLGRPIRLVFMPDDSERRVDENYDSSGAIVGFQDAFSFLVTSEASLSELNGRLSRPIEMRRFRPNLVLRGVAAFDEDRAKHFIAGDVRLRATKRCSRCVIPTLDPETGEAGLEPLQTLAGYRRDEDGKVYFGMNAQHETLGVLRVGDPVLLV